jgi:RimJ/RimL family protein N-acetyltransferase
MFHEIARDDVFRLETPRLWLRWPRRADAPALAALANDWQVARHTAHIPSPYTPVDAESFIRFARERNAKGAALDLVATLKSGSREVVGGLTALPAQSGMELGYWLGRPYWGQGLASEAVQALAEALFLFTPARRIDARVLPVNAASRGVLARAGFRAAGETVAEGRHAGRPAQLYALPRADWIAARRLQAAAASVTA